MINYTPPGGGGGVTDHGALTGLADDDHTQYFRADGSRVATADFDLAGNNIDNVGQLGGLTVPASPGTLKRTSDATDVSSLSGLGTGVGAALAVALNAALGLVRTEADGSLPAISGANLTNLPSSGAIKKIAYTIDNTTYSVAGNSWYSPGFSCSLTPETGSTGIIAIAFLNMGTSSSSYCAVARFISNVAGAMTVGATAGLRTSVSTASPLSTSQVSECTIFDCEVLLGDYSARTYDVQLASVNAGATAYINKTGGDANSASVVRTVSGILLINY